jgi:hypothetical protein
MTESFGFAPDPANSGCPPRPAPIAIDRPVDAEVEMSIKKAR